MNLYTIVLCTGILVSLLGVSKCGGSDDGQKVEFTILHTNDMHSHLRPEPVRSVKNPYDLGGLARLKTLIDDIKSEKKNVLVMDAGDWSEGTLYYNIDGGKNMLELMNAIGYNVATVGNHDFLIGPVQLSKNIESANLSFPLLGANKNVSAVPDPTDRERINRTIQDYTILNVSGVRVGVVGLLTDEYLYYEFFKPGVITNPIEKAIAITKKLHDENLADVIVLLSHNQFVKHTEGANAWAKIIPWVNVIISGHSHIKTAKVVEVKKGDDSVYVAETEEWARFLGDMTLVYDTKTKKTKLKNFTLHPVSAEIPENKTINDMILEQDRKLNAKYGKDVVGGHIADSTDEMNYDSLREVPLLNFNADAFRFASGADVALETDRLVGSGFSQGPLSILDVGNAAPHIYSPIAGQSFPEHGSTWTLKKLTLRGVDLRGLLQLVMIASKFDIPLGWIGISGGQITYDLTNGGMSPITSLKILNKNSGQYEPIQDQGTYTVAVHDGLFLSMRLLVEKLSLNIDLSRVEDTGIETWLANVMFATQKQIIRAADFEAGTRYHSQGPDVGFYVHNIQVRKRMDGKGVVVAVVMQNEGLSALGAGYKVHVTHGAPNDPVNDAQAGSPSLELSADVAIPPLNAGDRTIVEIPWTKDTPVAGAVYGLDFSLIGKDANSLNNTLHYHMRIPAK